VAAWDKVLHDEHDDMSYYQRQQKKYGRGRRGSTSFHGAFDVFFNAHRSDETKDAEHDGDVRCCSRGATWL
jgi:hypothetical protein